MAGGSYCVEEDSLAAGGGWHEWETGDIEGNSGMG